MPSPDQWGRARAYEPYVGRWSLLVALRFVDWLAPTPGARWVDIGCGTGALTEAILGASRPASVQGIDPSPEYVAFARSRIPDSRAMFVVGGADRLPRGGNPSNYTVSGLVLNFIPDPAGALMEMKRITRSKGCIAAYVWDYAEGMEMIRFFWDAAVELDPKAASLDEGARFPICRPDQLQSLWEGAALRDVTVIPIDIETVFPDFDDYWSPFLGGQGPAPAYNLSLQESARERLKASLRRRLPVQEDGSIRLRARAWAVRGST